jgi:hypothetical protein
MLALPILVVLVRVVISISLEQELLEVAYVPKVVLILGVFKILKLCFKQSL